MKTWQEWKEQRELNENLSRRNFLKQAGAGMGAMAMGGLSALGGEESAGPDPDEAYKYSQQYSQTNVPTETLIKAAADPASQRNAPVVGLGSALELIRRMPSGTYKKIVAIKWSRDYPQYKTLALKVANEESKGGMAKKYLGKTPNGFGQFQ